MTTPISGISFRPNNPSNQGGVLEFGCGITSDSKLLQLAELLQEPPSRSECVERFPWFCPHSWNRAAMGIRSLRGESLQRVIAVLGATAFLVQGYNQALMNGFTTLPAFFATIPQVDTVHTKGA